MARRKRASMREGPLADLFRSTTGDEPRRRRRGGDQPTEMMGTEGAEAPAPVEDRPTETERPVRCTTRRPSPSASPIPSPCANASASPDPGDVSVYKVDEPVAETPAAKDRLRNIFVDEQPPDGPAVRPRRAGHPSARRRHPGVHAPVIRVIGVGGAGVNADQPDGRGRHRRGRVPGDQHRPSVAPAEHGRRHRPHRRRGHARPRLGLRPGARPPGRVRRAGQDQAPAQGLRHGLHRRGRRGRDRHRRRAGHRAARADRRRADRRHRDQAVRVRGQPPRQAGRGRARGAERRGRHADRDPQRAPAHRAVAQHLDGRRRSRSPTTCCARASRGSPISSRCPR